MIGERVRRYALIDERWLTVSDIANQLQVDEQTVRRWIRAGRLVARNLGGKAGYRIHPNDLNAYINSLPVVEVAEEQELKRAA